MTEQIDTIVRFHDATRIAELSRCIFSLVGQSHRPLRIILTVQRFSEIELRETEAALKPLLHGEEDVSLLIVNWEHAEPADTRSALLDLGIRNLKGRYFAFLDYDDVLYPEAYELLISQMKQAGAGIAFASVRLMSLDVYKHFFYSRNVVDRVFHGKGLLDLFRSNFCPLHSYVIDRSLIPADTLILETSNTLEEDYDLLLRICAQVKSDFVLLAHAIGDYNFKTDDSNTISATGGRKPGIRYEEIKSAIELRRRVTPVALHVQEALGVPNPSASLSIREVINCLSANSSGPI